MSPTKFIHEIFSAEIRNNMNCLKNICSRLREARKKRILYTLWFNFKHFSFHQAKTLPIVFFKGAYAAVCDGGKIVLTEPFWENKGKVYIGVPTMDFEYQCEKTYLNITSGRIEFTGKFEARRGTLMEIRGVAIMGANVRFAPRCRLRVHNSIEIGDNVGFSHESQVFDTNFHYTEPVGKEGFYPISSPIRIGSHVWVCNRCTLMPGTIIPDYTIVASNSLVNKDFSKLRHNSLIGGVPAKLIKEGVARVWDTKREFEYHKREFEWYRKMYEKK